MITNVTVWLDQTAGRMPHKRALADDRNDMSFAQLRCMSLAIARELIRRNVYEKKPVVVFMEKSIYAVAAFAGIAYSRNFYTPVDRDMPQNRINKIIGVLHPEAVITTADLKPQFEESGFAGQYILLEEVKPNEDDSGVVEPVSSRIIDTDLLYVLFTSGSTGMPKGAAITHRAVIDYIDWVTDTFSISEEDRFGNQAPFYFDNSILDIYSMMKTGAAVQIIPKNLFAQPVRLLEYLKEKQINTIFWVPSALIMVSKLKAFRYVDLGMTLKRVLFCGEVMPNRQLNIWRKYLPKVLYANLYGPTEITDACTYYIVDREFSDDESLPIGIPMKNTEIMVFDDENRLIVESGQKGELCVAGTGVSVGYYNDKERTDKAFVQNPLNQAYKEIIYRTGDMVSFNDRHELIYLGRKDFQIKHMGHRIELGEIETAVSSLAGIHSNCCLYDEKRHRIVLVIEGDIGREVLMEQLEGMLPEYMFPGKVIHVDKMPLNANGKIDRIILKNYMEEKGGRGSI